MDAETGGLVGALLGFAIGWFEYRVLSRVVIAGLRRTDRSANDAEGADYERRIRLMQAAMVVLMIGGTPVVGYLIGRSLSGLDL